MSTLVDGIVATGSGAFQAGVPPAREPSPAVTSREPSVEHAEHTQSSGSLASVTSPNQVCCFSGQPLALLLIYSQAAEEDTDELETGKKKRRQPPDTPEPGRSRKHCRQQQQEEMHGLLAGMSQAVQTMSSSFQPASAPPQKRRESAIELMEKDGNFSESERIPVLYLFTKSIEIADSYLAIKDKNTRKGFIEHALASS